MSLEFHYWGIRGLGHLVQLSLELTETKYTTVHHLALEQWGALKQELIKTHNFVNLPCLIDGEFYLSESNALIHHIVQKADRKDLLGKGDDEVKVIQLRDVLKDIFTKSIAICYQSKDVYTEENWKNHVNTIIIPRMQSLNKQIDDKSFLLGYITIADLYLVHITQMVQKAEPGCVDSCPNVIRVIENVMKMPQIQAFYESDRCAKTFLPPFSIKQI